MTAIPWCTQLADAGAERGCGGVRRTVSLHPGDRLAHKPGADTDDGEVAARQRPGTAP
ncbi:hypothetical protein [Streptomyces albipurpureus]|uniref:Uncharacterized protein n=1 Tax=Streptomyces albipurpureus TaxID=2897419 RepID=A0ABT0V0Z3_9ACTN|nr:hypothetical protein [Streptomyces sp. CWNU-1]MCM2393233.1 hypothetical protein [Streptomyces sp. CWNU-1]